MTETQITRKDALLYGGAAAGGLVVGGAAIAAVAVAVDNKKPPVEGAPIVAPYVEGDLPTSDPAARAWKGADRTYVALAPQQIAQPFLEKAGITSLDARALHNGAQVALLLEWDDDSVDDLDGIRRYHDAVAVQLPTRSGAPPALTMGAPGSPVHILQWRATWQRDIDSGGNTGVDQIYPAVVHDVMPDDVLPPKTAQLYWVGREAGNPLSQNVRSSPVEEVVAEGFGSVTHLPNQAAVGHGVNDDGRWRVVIAIPSARDGVGEPLAPGSSWPVAFAVWLGSEENRGGRKHIANWQTLQLEGK
ncbi:MAG: ethylbenzene dehydrogenase-related protein [Thermoleophilia bacterium]|nr:ethylbenzene dehydrogenase-related protein [Thermoleophilia bacterium]MDH4339877.1 ethylbenzene dehydrogenase-related protein [Thermoleophilia bacterium]MDH5280495.1 ethylbenzene dehydrogenase-related protein [Thermoleophilia bacterium]